MDESESPSWKGHSFTLLVFGGIVVLCSIFFVLGMLVGRSQGQRIAEMAAADEVTRQTAPQPLPESPPPDIFTQTTGTTPEETLEPRPKPPTAPEVSVPSPAPPPGPESGPLKEPVDARVSLQILATKDPKNASLQRDKVQSKGFRALILAPMPGDKDSFYRVLVGPFDSTEAAIAKKELEALGYENVYSK